MERLIALPQVAAHDEISAASQEQSNGIALVGKAVMEMDAVTQQNANLVQETNQAADELVGEAFRLREAVERFRLDEAAFETGRSQLWKGAGSWAQRQFENAERQVAWQDRTSSGVDDLQTF